jgi:hypothetical protein
MPTASTQEIVARSLSGRPVGLLAPLAGLLGSLLLILAR